ncbi:4521_t:CDS:2 [Funneliformis mosseae]|uniref:4521_t:CDS:1 n=1 Tax=Funneliformis mosseae TaxID=27381 RepID=A0A9N9HE18_FUNMO|nr:4521_t:CDS:2 [Funneliformis mosseae]
MQTDNLISASNTIVYYKEVDYTPLGKYSNLYSSTRSILESTYLGGAPSTAEYVINVPVGVTAHNFVIDLYQTQQVV